MEKYCLKIDFSIMGVISIRKNRWAAIKILFQTSLSPLGVYSYMEVTKSVQDGIVGSTDRLSLNLTLEPLNQAHKPTKYNLIESILSLLKHRLWQNV